MKNRLSFANVGHDRFAIHQGGCLEVMRGMADASVDSIVTDPPYELGFMGKKWDASGVAFNADVWREALRVLKPGGHLLAFSGSRTYHRMTCAIEDAGFEIRDQIMWLYGSGFPKSRNLDGEWQGWGTALKPAHEPICVARKPLAKGCTVAANVLAHGTGALNIDGCRVGDEVRWNPPVGELTGIGSSREAPKGEGREVTGRWPANVIHDGSDEVLAAFPDAPGQQGDLKETGRARPSSGRFGDMAPPKAHAARVEFDKSAARFFYCAKASKRDRDEGLEHREAVTAAEITGRKEGSAGLVMDGGKANPYAGTTGAARRNNHPTVKPTDLMRYLCRLVTPPGGLVLDPFMGSGSTGKAAMLEGFRFVGIELSEEYIEIARARIASAAQ